MHDYSSLALWLLKRHVLARDFERGNGDDRRHVPSAYGAKSMLTQKT
jgi:hypothetical protein